MPEAGGGARLSELEARWRSDRSPRVFLQLSDELRKAGAHERAVRVLQEGLSHHPDSVSGRVALGRLQLEQGDAAGAAETLERALARDPAQMVASKLLIEARIRMGDATRARERLDLYRILQERDGEIDDFERRIAVMERAERQAALDAELASDPDLAEQDDPVAARPSRLFDLAVADPLPPIDLMSSFTAAGPASAVGRPERTADLAAVDARMPFGEIHEPVAGALRIERFLRAGALFGLPATLDTPAPHALDIADEIERLELEGASEPVAADGAERETPLAFEKFSTLTFADEVERDTLEEPLARVLAEAGVDGVVLAPEGAVVGVGADAVEEARAPVSDAAGPPSATLGRLYLDQGHLAEAESEFRRVVAERPEDGAAQGGLEEIRRRRAADETVSGWSGAALSTPRPLRAVGLTQRKIETLRDYLERLRRGRARAHVS